MYVQFMSHAQEAILRNQNEKKSACTKKNLNEKHEKIEYKAFTLSRIA